MSFQSFLDQIEKGLPSSVYFFYASDPFLHREAIGVIKRLVPEEEKDFNLHIYDLSFSKEENLTLEKILDVANTVSFFGSRRFTLLIGNIQKISKNDSKKLDNYISKPAPNSVFIMLHEGTLNKEMRERLKTLKPTSLDIKEGEIPYWIKQRGVMKGIEMSNKAVDYLIGLVGPDLGLLSAEIEKLSLLGKKRIDVNDISEITTGEKLHSVFELIDALKAKDAERVFKIYATLRETAEDYSLIGVLNWHFGRHLISGDVKQNDYYLKVFKLLNSADIAIKSSGGTFPIEYLLARLIRI
jgi:DNA polymerase-3 subunit delta